MRLDDPEPLLYGGESLLHEGVAMAASRRAPTGSHVGAAVGLAWLECAPGEAEALLSAGGGAVEVDVAGARVPATLWARPFYDPTGARRRG